MQGLSKPTSPRIMTPSNRLILDLRDHKGKHQKRDYIDLFGTEDFEDFGKVEGLSRGMSNPNSYDRKNLTTKIAESLADFASENISDFPRK